MPDLPGQGIDAPYSPAPLASAVAAQAFKSHTHTVSFLCDLVSGWSSIPRSPGCCRPNVFKHADFIWRYDLLFCDSCQHSLSPRGPSDFTVQNGFGNPQLSSCGGETVFNVDAWVAVSAPSSGSITITKSSGPMFKFVAC